MKTSTKTPLLLACATLLGTPAGAAAQSGLALEEVVVTARKRTTDVIPAYDFKPGKVTVSSDVYVEYQLK